MTVAPTIEVSRNETKRRNNNTKLQGPCCIHLISFLSPSCLVIMSEPKPMTKVLIYGGKTGWIGGKMYTLCKEHGEF
jgi:hypothetical protein